MFHGRSRSALLVAVLLYSVAVTAQKVETKNWDNGTPKLRETLDKKGFKTGECTYWYENGQMKLREVYERGRRSGKCEGWFEDGTPQFDRTYVVLERNNGSLMGTEPMAVKDGLWVEFHDNGQKMKEEHYALGVLQGIVRTWYENGEPDEVKGMEDKFENGPYEKHFENGQLSTKGHFTKGEKTGEWQTWHANGQLAYAETFVSDKHIDGPWRGKHPNGGDSLNGSYVSGRKEGLWTALHPNGKMKSKTLYRFGMPSGSFVEFYANGNKSREGAFGGSTAEVKRGREEGEWKEWHENGQLMRVVSYEDGRMDGPCTEWYANGQKRFETSYMHKARKDDMMDGMTREWHENGQPMSEGVYMGGLRDGLWKEWYPSGSLHTQAIFDKAKVNGAVTEYYEDGKEMSKGFYEVAGRKKKRTGHWTTWYASGGRQNDGEYIDNKRVGRWQEWYANGALKEDAFFNDGMNQGAFKDFHENGTLRTEGQYKGERKHQGLQHGVWKHYSESGDLVRTETWYNGRQK